MEGGGGKGKLAVKNLKNNHGPSTVVQIKKERNLTFSNTGGRVHTEQMEAYLFMAHKSPLSFSANVTAKFIVLGCRRQCRELKVKRFGHIKYVYVLYILCGNNVAKPV